MFPQSHYRDLGYEPRYEVCDPYQENDNSFHVTIYDWSRARGTEIISEFVFNTPEKAEKFVELMTAAVEDWDCGDYYYRENPQQDYEASEMSSLVGGYRCQVTK